MPVCLGRAGTRRERLANPDGNGLQPPRNRPPVGAPRQWGFRGASPATEKATWGAAVHRPVALAWLAGIVPNAVVVLVVLCLAGLLLAQRRWEAQNVLLAAFLCLLACK